MQFINETSNIVMPDSDSSEQDSSNSYDEDICDDSSSRDRYSFESDSYNRHTKDIMVQKSQGRLR